MSAPNIERLRSIKTLPSLIAYLRDELDWPIDASEVEDIFFEYDPEELGLSPDQAAKIKEIKQLRPMDANQPWGIFWVNFENKRLPVVMLRRILGHLVIKKRASANKASRRAWHLNDLLFISAYGEDTDRAITFAHFAQDAKNPDDLPVLKVLGWDGGDTVLHLVDAHRTLSEKLRWPSNPGDLDAWRDQWANVFTLRHREVISTTQQLVEELAKLATSIRKRASSILSRESERGPLRRLYAAFKTALIHDLSEGDFADVIAQTISYGLLAARFSSKGGISIKSLVEMIPPTNPFLRELLAELLAVAGRKKGAFEFDELGIQDVVDLLNQANAEAVKSDFGNKTRNEDPVIHFYEHFLHAYDRQKKVQRGVFFTPQPVVSYIVRSVHVLLQTEFDLEDGLADTTTWGEMVKRNKDLKIPEGAKPGDPFVLILDPAIGTATFLVEVIDIIFMHLKKKWTDFGKKPAEISRLWNEYVPKNLLPRLYGYELMMAPYTIAHMKLFLKLQEINARLGQPDFRIIYIDRAHIYLTNSLEPAGDCKQGALEGVFPALAHEAAAVNRVKRGKRFTVVIGNPPYAGVSANMSETASDLIKPYKFVNGQPLGERKHWLQDDYVKFIRLGQLLLENTGVGTLGYITNHGYLDNPTFRGMRQNLFQSFSAIRVLDLHGSVKKRDSATLAKRDENVFDIEQGVAISLLLRTAKRALQSEVWHAMILGPRSDKYDWLLKQTLVSGDAVTPTSPYYFFIRREESHRDEYEALTPVTSVFRIWSTGVQTSRDSFAIAESRQELEKRLNRFLDPSVKDEEVKSAYGLKDMSFWQVAKIRKAFRRVREPHSYIKPIDYRPFDTQHVVFHEMIIHRPKAKVMSHMLAGRNLALLLPRQLAGEHFYHAFCSRNLAEMCVISTKTTEQNNLFPLYIFDQSPLQELLLASPANRSQSKHPNFDESFLKSISEKLKLERNDQGLPNSVTPEDIFHYTYASFHSPTYRTRYAEFLKIDFPRLPLTSSLDLFRALAELGGELVALHLMKSPKLDKHITNWIGGKAPEVEKVGYSDETIWIDKAKSEGLRGVPEPVWNFHIGGYQVCEKWLKDRKGRKLSKDDITHYQKIVVALTETIRIMKEIDVVIEKHGGWPNAFKPKTDKT